MCGSLVGSDELGIHYVARGGLASFAIAACDIALWDLRAKKHKNPSTNF